MEDPAKPYFYQGITDRERAIFEGGIALAYIYHQFIGTPVPKERKAVRILEKAIEHSTLAQPFREKASVKISLRKVKNKEPYTYPSLNERMLEAKVVVKYGRARVYVAMEFIRELRYPLMYVVKVEESR